MYAIWQSLYNHLFIINSLSWVIPIKHFFKKFWSEHFRISRKSWSNVSSNVHEIVRNNFCPKSCTRITKNSVDVLNYYLWYTSSTEETSSRFSWNSESFASEFLVYLDEMVHDIGSDYSSINERMMNMDVLITIV